MKIKNTLLWALIGGFLFTSCNKDDNTPDIKDENKINTWIYHVMNDNYLYYKDMPSTSQLDINLSPSNFFTSLLSRTNEMKYNDNQVGYFYSYIEVPESATKADLAKNTYGLDYVIYRLPDNTYLVRVLYVLPNSSADQAGIRRGDYISQVNNEKLSASNINKLRSGGAVSLIKAYYDADKNGFVEDKTNPVAMSASSTMYENPVYLSKVIETQGKKIGYLMYNAFRTGPTGFEDKSYDRELIQKITSLKADAVDEMILDLRYNGGGYLTSAVTLGSLLCPQSALSELFAITRMNDKQESSNSERNKFFHSKDSIGASNLDLKRLYIIAGSQTASASELIINCLRPYMDVIHVGSRTEGKNVGSLEYTSTNFPGYILHPITSKIFNKDHQSDYRNGFVPDSKNLYDEFDKPEVSMYPLGDINDPYVQLALKDMGLNTSDQPVTRSVRSLNLRMLKREPVSDCSGIRL